MATLIEKVRVVVLAQAHELVDRMIDMESVPVVKQYVRELEEAIGKLEDAVAGDIGEQRGLLREKDELVGKISERDEILDDILTDHNPDNDKYALKWQLQLNALKAQLETTKKVYAAGEAVVTAEQKTIDTLKARKDEMVAQISRLEASERIAEKQKEAAEKVQAVNRIMGDLNGGPSVDNLIVRAERRADVAGAMLEQAVSSMPTSDDQDMATVQAEMALAERRLRLQQRKEESSGAGESGNAASDRLQN